MTTKTKRSPGRPKSQPVAAPVAGEIDGSIVEFDMKASENSSVSTEVVAPESTEAK